MNDNFFGRSGTIQGLMDFGNAYQGARSSQAFQRGNSLAKLVEMVMALLA